MGCRMTKKSKKTSSQENKDMSNGVCPPDLDSMKRKELQKLCKSFKLKANGKNVDMVESLQAHYNQLELKEISETKTEHIIEDVNNCEEVDVPLNKEHIEDCDENVNELVHEPPPATPPPATPPPATSPPATSPPVTYATSPPSPSSPKDWNWIARWCVVDGVLKQDAADRWVLLRLIGGRTVIVDEDTKEQFDFVLEPTILPTPEKYDDNYVCGDCARKNKEKLSGWVGIKRAEFLETPKSSLGKENMDDSLLRQSFKRKREEVLSPRSVVDNADSPMKLRRLNPRSCSPASPQDRRERGEDFQLPKNLRQPWRPKKVKSMSPKEDADFAQKVEKIITNLSPDEQRDLVFGKQSTVLHSPPHNKHR